jgi:hypothetical protein
MDVTEYMARLEHSRKSDVEQIRLAILVSDPGLSETIKWNAPNFVFDGEDRVTFRLQPGDRVELVLHRGVRTRTDSATFAFHDPSGMVTWAAPDRGVITVPEGADLDRLLQEILPVIHTWVRA